MYHVFQFTLGGIIRTVLVPYRSMQYAVSSLRDRKMWREEVTSVNGHPIFFVVCACGIFIYFTRHFCHAFLLITEGLRHIFT